MKDEQAFKNEPDKPCYSPETSDRVYTRNDLIKLCEGDVKKAELLFTVCDWQHPETILEETPAEDWNEETP